MFKNIRKLNTVSYICCIIVCFVFASTHSLTAKTCMVKASAKELNKIQVEEHVQTIEYSKTYSGPPTIMVNTLQNNITPTDIAENVIESVDDMVEDIIENYEPESPLTEEEIELLARVVHAESGNQDEIGKRLVADVVLNRMAKYDASLHDIVYADNQFSTAPYLYNNSNNPTEEELKIARQESIEQYDYEVGYFRLGSYHPYGTPAFIHGAHYFNNL